MRIGYPAPVLFMYTARPVYIKSTGTIIQKGNHMIIRLVSVDTDEVIHERGLTMADSVRPTDHISDMSFAIGLDLEETNAHAPYEIQTYVDGRLWDTCYVSIK